MGAGQLREQLPHLTAAELQTGGVRGRRDDSAAQKQGGGLQSTGGSLAQTTDHTTRKVSGGRIPTVEAGPVPGRVRLVIAQLGPLATVAGLGGRGGGGVVGRFLDEGVEGFRAHELHRLLVEGEEGAAAAEGGAGGGAEGGVALADLRFQRHETGSIGCGRMRSTRGGSMRRSELHTHPRGL